MTADWMRPADLSLAYLVNLGYLSLVLHEFSATVSGEIYSTGSAAAHKNIKKQSGQHVQPIRTVDVSDAV